MKRILPFLVFLVFAACLSADALAERREGIAAVVNEDAITYTDVNDRMKLVMVSSNLPQTKEMRDRLTPQVVSMLIEEQLKIQEARNAGVEISEEAIMEGLTVIAQQNKMTLAQFRELLKRQGIEERTLERQVESQIGWTRFVQQNLQPRIRIMDSDIDDRIGFMKESLGKTEYLVSEIFLPVSAPSEEDDVKQVADRLVREIRSGQVPFAAAARQFSQAAGAAEGGVVGWVGRGQFPDELDRVLPSLPENTASQPIRTLSGIHILMVQDKRSISSSTIPPREQIMNQIGLERLERLQRRHLLDLRAVSFIENRV